MGGGCSGEEWGRASQGREMLGARASGRDSRHVLGQETMRLRHCCRRAPGGDRPGVVSPQGASQRGLRGFHPGGDVFLLQQESGEAHGHQPQTGLEFSPPIIAVATQTSCFTP